MASLWFLGFAKAKAVANLAPSHLDRALVGIS